MLSTSPGQIEKNCNDDGTCQCSHQGYECIIMYIYICIYIYTYAYIPTCCWFILDVGRYTYAYHFQDFSYRASPRRWYGHGKLSGGSMSHATSAHSGSGEGFPVSQVRLHGSHQGLTPRKKRQQNGANILLMDKILHHQG